MRGRGELGYEPGPLRRRRAGSHLEGDHDGAHDGRRGAHADGGAVRHAGARRSWCDLRRCRHRVGGAGAHGCMGDRDARACRPTPPRGGTRREDGREDALQRPRRAGSRPGSRPRCRPHGLYGALHRGGSGHDDELRGG